jgi:hypothetical protein
VIDEAELQHMTRQERARLTRALAAMDMPRLATVAGSRRRSALVLGAVVCCLFLAAWTGLLAATLPGYYRAGDWRGAWVGFDVAELVAFAVTAWAAWRARQLLITFLIVVATLLLVDAWFDVMLDMRTSGFTVSLLSALLVELPLAIIAISCARRLLRLTVARVRNDEGLPGPVPPLWQVPLLAFADSRMRAQVLPGSAGQARIPGMSWDWRTYASSRGERVAEVGLPTAKPGSTSRCGK